MSVKLSSSQLSLVLREAETTAACLIRRLGLPSHHRDDVRQDLLADLIGRLAAFDPDRGTLGAFASTVYRHRARRIALMIERDRRLFGRAPVSLDADRGPDGAGRFGDALAEEHGYAAALGQPTDRFAEADCRLDLERALGSLPEPLLSVCALLHRAPPATIARSGPIPRSSLYRRIRELRLALAAAGIALPA